MTRSSPRTPWMYVPTLYFAEGLPFVIVYTASAVMYKKLGMSNQFIGLTSILYLPWVIKMFWSPLIDSSKTKRLWITASQLVMSGLFTLLALSLHAPSVAACTLGVFILIAFMSATQDIAVDGYYMLSLDKKDQAFFLGIRSTFYRLAMVFGSGILVVLAGTLEKITGRIALSWSAVMAVAGIILMGCFFFHRLYLPYPAADAPCDPASIYRGFRNAFRTYAQQKKIVPVVSFILLYRLGEALLTKMAVPFLLDSPDAGGLGLATDTVGYVYGTAGVVSLCAGGILGGWLISRFGLKRCIWPMAVMLNAPDILYVYMAAARPSLTAVSAMVAVEQFGYGLGFTAFAVFLMYSAQDPFKTSHFAISTGLMALGMMLPGMCSGIIQAGLGYTGFFTTALILSLPGMALLFFIPIDQNPG